MPERVLQKPVQQADLTMSSAIALLDAKHTTVPRDGLSLLHDMKQRTELDRRTRVAQIYDVYIQKVQEITDPKAAHELLAIGRTLVLPFTRDLDPNVVRETQNVWDTATDHKGGEWQTIAKDAKTITKALGLLFIEQRYQGLSEITPYTTTLFQENPHVTLDQITEAVASRHVRNDDERIVTRRQLIFLHDDKTGRALSEMLHVSEDIISKDRQWLIEQELIDKNRSRKQSENARSINASTRRALVFRHHEMDIDEIKEIIEKALGQQVSRKQISEDLTWLRDHGVSIKRKKSGRKLGTGGNKEKDELKRQKVLTLFYQGKKDKEIRQIVGSNPNGLLSKLRKEGVIVGRRPTPAETRAINARKEEAADVLAKEFGLSENTILAIWELPNELFQSEQELSSSCTIAVFISTPPQSSPINEF